MTTKQTQRGYLLEGKLPEIRMALLSYFERGFMIVPESASHMPYMSGHAYLKADHCVEVELRKDWVYRLDEREKWKRNRRSA